MWHNQYSFLSYWLFVLLGWSQATVQQGKCSLLGYFQLPKFRGYLLFLATNNLLHWSINFSSSRQATKALACVHPLLKLSILGLDITKSQDLLWMGTHAGISADAVLKQLCVGLAMEWEISWKPTQKINNKTKPNNSKTVWMYACVIIYTGVLPHHLEKEFCKIAKPTNAHRPSLVSPSSLL